MSMTHGLTKRPRGRVGPHRDRMVNSSVLYERGKYFHVTIKRRSTITSAYIGALPGGKEGHYSKQPQKLEDYCACVPNISLNNNNEKY